MRRRGDSDDEQPAAKRSASSTVHPDNQGQFQSRRDRPVGVVRGRRRGQTTPPPAEHNQAAVVDPPQPVAPPPEGHIQPAGVDPPVVAPPQPVVVDPPIVAPPQPVAPPPEGHIILLSATRGPEIREDGLLLAHPDDLRLIANLQRREEAAAAERVCSLSRRSDRQAFRAKVSDYVFQRRVVEPYKQRSAERRPYYGPAQLINLGSPERVDQSDGQAPVASLLTTVSHPDDQAQSGTVVDRSVDQDRGSGGQSP